jgi:hypothetical protein
MWGAQLEVGAFPTSYIPTTSASVTRGADIATISSLSGWHNAVEGTMYEESVPLTTATGTYYHSHFYVAADSENNRIGPIHVTDTSMEHAVVNGGVFQFQSTAAGVSAGSTFRSAMTWKANDFAQSCNGAAASTDAAGTLPAVDRFGIGNRGGFTPFASAHIRRIVYLPQRISNANLATLSGSTPTLASGSNLIAVATGQPRSYYTATGVYGGYLAEGARTNAALQSQDLATTWTNDSTTEVVNSMVAPDGTVTADKLVESVSADVSHAIFQAFTYTNVVHTLSAFLKAGERTQAMLSTFDGTTTTRVWFNLSAGTVGTQTNATGTIESWGNGWYRCTLTTNAATAAALGNYQIFIAEADNDATHVGDGTSGIYVWGAQLEAASFASTYIPTTTLAVARNADVLTYPTANNLTLSTNSGTVYLETVPTPLVLTSSRRNALSTTDSGSGRLEIRIPQDASITAAGLAYGTGAAVVDVSSTTITSGLNKIACSYGPLGGRNSVNGGTLGSDATASDIAASTDFGIGCTNVGATIMFGAVKNVRIWNRALQNTTLTQLTR